MTIISTTNDNVKYPNRKMIASNEKWNAFLRSISFCVVRC